MEIGVGRRQKPNPSEGYLHVLFKTPASDPYPNWIRIASTEHPLDSESRVPAHVLRHGMTLLRFAEGDERAALEGAPPMQSQAKCKKSTPRHQIEREIQEVLSSRPPLSSNR
jgi:hypothetical protein